MKKTIQNSDKENPNSIFKTQISSILIEGGKGFVSYDADSEIFTCRTLKSGSEKIQITYGDGYAESEESDANPIIDVSPIHIDKNALGGAFLEVSQGGTGKDSFLNNSILLGNGKEALKELVIGETGQLLISTEDALSFAKLESEELEIETKSTKISLKTKPITLKTHGGLYIGDVKNNAREKKNHLAEEVVLTADKIQVHLQGGLSGGGSVGLGETITLSSKEDLKWVPAERGKEMKTNTGYIVTSNIEGETTMLHLPQKPEVGNIIKVVDEGSTDKKLSGKLVWKINLRDHETIYFGRSCAQKRKETQGFLAGKHLSDCVTILCTKFSPTQINWIVVGNIGNLNVND